MVAANCTVERTEEDMRSQLRDQQAAETKARESAEAKVRSVWKKYQQAEKTLADIEGKYEEVLQFRGRTGMELGKACFDLRSSAQVVTGGTTFRKDLDRLGLNPKTAYKWLGRYEKKLLAERELANRTDAQRVVIDELITSLDEKEPEAVVDDMPSNEETVSEEVPLEEEPEPRFTRQRQSPVRHAALFSDDLVRFASLLPFAAAQAAFHEAAKIVHPDHGGTEEDMQALNQAWEAVKEYYRSSGEGE
jgi:hypothetical protein